MERKNPEGHLPFQTQLAYQEELPDLFRDRFHRRNRRAYSAEESAMPRRTGGIKNGKAKFAWTESKTKSNRPLLRTLFETEPGLGGKIGKSPPAVDGISRTPPVVPGDPTLFPLPAAEAKSARALRPLWRDLIMKVWGEDPLLCPCCKGTMRVVGTMMRREEVEFYLRLHGLWEGVVALPPSPRPPFDIETLEPLDVPPQWGWSDEIGPPPEDWWIGEETMWEAPELDFGDGRVLVLDAGDPFPVDDLPVFAHH